ncbi:autotransporter domain-containing protein [Trinickia caryophylli]|uniref:Autotransporter-associated beta strand repeat-containing protein n=1 Tax=Trinickia caryophylli TaxID=28094 RepID=A0A1X7D4K9_TRICW|nr:autotransporter domain-containing protein [Trinickia caryophylli]PMS12829.1 autotransporter domain-containing protein [Trinickia caryophylli]TRX15145.1 autotransporter domain-containing protein [Trinickia caryophylli]SMF08760.1 autotransporter-associated beta strand repeat-containing protein [Trinickia caryophylli]
MNRRYRLVWNHALQTTQVASELTVAKSATSGRSTSRRARRERSRRLARVAGNTALALGLASAAPAIWAATCTSSDTTACSPAGGNGAPGRGGSGGAGNGQGGGASSLGGSGTVLTDGGLSTGGTGGTGVAGDQSSPTTGGAPGAATSISSVVVNGDLSAGAGTQPVAGLNFGGGGSGGGTGLYYSGTSVTINSGVTISGGKGGDGGTVSNLGSGNGGGGGGGGAGMIAATIGTQITTFGSLVAGNGGAGGDGGFGGGGGGGGDGLLSLGGSTQITNLGSITGGAGGAAGTGFSGNGTSGASGVGVNLVGGNNVLVNAGTITGGAGIGAGAGVGVMTRGSDFINNFGTISGGLDSGGTRAAAIEFSGANNTLALSSGSVFVGGLVIDAGASVTVMPLSNGLSLDTTVSMASSSSALTFNTVSTALTTTGVISGPGTVTLTGGKTLTLTGTNTYTGTTTITNGTLALSGSGSIAASGGVVDNSALDISATTAGASITALTGSGAVALGGKTLTLSNAAGTFSGVIGGSGGLTVAGGTQTLTGANTYTGTTTIGSGAALVLGAGGGLASSSNVVNNGTLDLSSTTSGASMAGLAGSGSVALGARTLTLTNAASTFSGTISGTGGLTLDGGTQTLTGANTYAGATTINGGTLALSGAGSLPSTTSIALAGSGATLDVSAAGAQAIKDLSGVTGSQLALGSNTLAVTTTTDATFAGTLTGSGAFAKQGSGTLTLNGISSGFTGATTVAAGTLEVGDASNATAVLGGNVTVASAGTLRGHGTVSGNVLNNGIVMPGGSIGTLTVGGNYTQASNATLTLEVSPSAGSQLKVNGSASLGGGLSIVYDPGTYTARRYALLTAANGLSGTFSSVAASTSTGTDLSSLKQSLIYGTNEVDLLLAAADTTSPGIGVIVAPTNTSIYTAVGTTALMRAQSFNEALLERSAAAPADEQHAGRRAWITATGSGTHVGGADGHPGFMAREYGFLAGADGRLGDFTIGAAGGYSHTSIDEQSTGASGATDSLRVALYGGRKVGPVGLSATVGYALDFLSQKRPFGSIGTAEGDHLGHEFTTAAQAALPMQLGGIVLTPSVGLRYAYFRGNGFGESGAGGQNLSVGADNARSLQPYASLAIDKAFGDALKPVNVQLRVGYARELLGSGRTVTVTAQDGTPFAAPGVALQRDYLTTGASVSIHPTKAMTVSLGFDALVNTGHASAQSGHARLDYRF